MKRILVVDDDEMVRKFVKIMLENNFYEVKIAKDGEEALKIIKENGLDMIIADMEMGEISGEELVEQILDINFLNGSDIKVILMSGNHNELYRIEKSVLGEHIGAFVSKPFYVDSFLEKIEILLR